MTTLFNQANAPAKGSKSIKKTVKKITSVNRASNAGSKYKTPGSKKKSPMTPGLDDSETFMSNDTQNTINFDIDGRVYEEDHINIELENEEYYRLKNEFSTQMELEEIKEEENLNYDTMEKDSVEQKAYE